VVREVSVGKRTWGFEPYVIMLRVGR